MLNGKRLQLNILIVVLAALGFAAFAQANEGTKDNGLSYCEENYLDLYKDVNPDGPNIVKEGVDGKEATDSRVCRKVKILHQIKQERAAAAAEEAAASEAATTTTTTTTTDSSGYAIPEYIVECESGGDYSASNPSGAYGAYQIMPGTAAAYGCDLSTASGQDQCAGEIYAAEGAAPWSCG
jgi:hypothetical protein